MSNQENNLSTQGEQPAIQDGQAQPNQGGVQDTTFASNQTPLINAENPDQNQANIPEFSQNNNNQQQPNQTNISFDSYSPDLNTVKSENSGSGHLPSSDPEEKGSRMGTVITIILMIVIAVGIWYTNKDNQELTNNTDNPVVVDDTKEDGQVKIVNGNPEELANKSETIKITAYYNKLSSNECENVIPLQREVEKKYDSEVINTIRGFLTPLTNEELSQGWISSLPDQTYLKSVVIKDGVAQATFSTALNNVAGSCRVLAIRSQIEKTLLQFSYIKSVTICIDNNCRQDEILQP